VLPNKPHHRRANCQVLQAWFAGALAIIVAGSGCQMMSHTQNSDGVRMFQQAYYQGALQSFQQAIQSDPKNPDGYYNLARTYHQLGKLHNQPADLQQAESYYHQCLDRDPNKQDCYRGLAVLLMEQNRSGDAFKLMEGWAARNPSLASPKIELARLYEETGNREAAKSQLIEAVGVDPNNSRALAALGKLREDAGETVQALANYQRSLQLNPNQPQLASRVGAISTPVAPMAPPPGTIPAGAPRWVAAPQGAVR
jgi:tetratricopeptide (TPR) repeat protein